VSPPGPAEELRRRLGAEVVLPDVPARYLSDATESRALRGRADAVALPRSTEEVASVLRACCDLGLAVVPRGGGTGFSGGCVPDGGVVLGLERMNRVASFEPLLWRMRVDAGVTTSTVRRLARESGLLFPPDPGAGEQSQLGGNVATNAGGPHAFKYGVTRAWVTGLEVVVPPGETIRLGGDARKDVAGLDLLGLFVGSEGTLGVVTSVWLRLVPAPEAALPVIALYPDAEAGCAALERIVGYGLLVSALEFLDAETMALAGGGLPVDGPEGPTFALIAEADGTEAAAAALRDEVEECCRDGALLVHSPRSAAEVAALWRWREGVSLAVEAARGGKVSEDVDVPMERLGELLDAMDAIGTRHDLRTCNWGHAGDGNVHATFLVDPGDPVELERAERAAGDLFAVALELGGTISGEHGIGLVKLPYRDLQFAPAERALQERVKQAFDPGWLLNPGKKLAAPAA
jgi:glycolate oxidase subunit GlcD